MFRTSYVGTGVPDGPPIRYLQKSLVFGPPGTSVPTFFEFFRKNYIKITAPDMGAAFRL